MTAKVITQLVFRHKRVLTMALRKNLKSNCNRGRPKFGLYTLRQVRSQMRFQVFQTQHACLSSTGRFISLSLFFFWSQKSAEVSSNNTGAHFVLKHSLVRALKTKRCLSTHVSTLAPATTTQTGRLLEDQERNVRALSFSRLRKKMSFLNQRLSRHLMHLLP